MALQYYSHNKARNLNSKTALLIRVSKVSTEVLTPLGNLMHPSVLSKPSSVKAFLAESPALTTVPPIYTFNGSSDDDQSASDPEEYSLPIIDYSLLLNGTPDQRSRIIQDIGNACTDWGFFMVVNHNVPESLMKGMIDACKEFFDLEENVRNEYTGKELLDPVKCGTSFNTSLEKVHFWRDYLKVIVHPQFHSPTRPSCFSELAREYSQRNREMARELLRAISESLGLEASYIEKAMNMEEKGFQLMVANLYPPCPQPELAKGMPPHSDHGLLTLLVQNGVGGLQLMRRSKWINVPVVPESILVNTGDQLEILTNGKYKSVLHRAVLNSKVTRISIGTANGPALDVTVSPAQELIERERHPPAYMKMTYKNFISIQQSNLLNGKSCLDSVRLH